MDIKMAKALMAATGAVAGFNNVTVAPVNAQAIQNTQATQAADSTQNNNIILIPFPALDNIYDPTVTGGQTQGYVAQLGSLTGLQASYFSAPVNDPKTGKGDAFYITLPDNFRKGGTVIDRYYDIASNTDDANIRMTAISLIKDLKDPKALYGNVDTGNVSDSDKDALGQQVSEALYNDVIRFGNQGAVDPVIRQAPSIIYKELQRACDESGMHITLYGIDNSAVNNTLREQTSVLGISAAQIKQYDDAHPDGQKFFDVLSKNTDIHDIIDRIIYPPRYDSPDARQSSAELCANKLNKETYLPMNVMDMGQGNIISCHTGDERLAEKIAGQLNAAINSAGFRDITAAASWDETAEKYRIAFDPQSTKNIMAAGDRFFNDVKFPAFHANGAGVNPYVEDLITANEHNILRAEFSQTLKIPTRSVEEKDATLIAFACPGKGDDVSDKRAQALVTLLNQALSAGAPQASVGDNPRWEVRFNSADIEKYGQDKFFAALSPTMREQIQEAGQQKDQQANAVPSAQFQSEHVFTATLPASARTWTRPAPDSGKSPAIG